MHAAAVSKWTRTPDDLLLKEWLCVTLEHDVIMPCKDKAPLFKHRDVAWTWKSYDSYMRSYNRSFRLLLRHLKESTGILLHDMCVVDVDDAQMASDLEQRFPVLTSVPAERTTRGMHYFFLRSERCDRHGHYDGHAQVTKGIDFKTRCRSGTRGFVEVAPSTGKSWLRAPWTVPIIPIPDDLLCAVSVPTHMEATATFRFIRPRDDDNDNNNNNVMTYKNMFLAHCATLAPFLEDESAVFDINVRALAHISPSAELMDDMFAQLHLVMRRPLLVAAANDKPYSSNRSFVAPHRQQQLVRGTSTTFEYMMRMYCLADFLGLPQRMIRKLDPTHPSCPYVAMADLARASLPWAKAVYDVNDVDDRGGNNAAATAVRLLEEIDDTARSTTVYTPIDMCGVNPGAWLMAGRNNPTSRHAMGGQCGKAVLRSAVETEQEIPPQVRELMRRFPGQLVLAGGAALGAMCKLPSPGTDYDLFLVGDGVTDACAYDILRAFLQMVDSVVSVSVRSVTAVISRGDDDVNNGDDYYVAHAHAATPKDNHHNHHHSCSSTVVIQLITHVFQDVQELLGSFDIDACKIALLYDNNNNNNNDEDDDNDDAPPSPLLLLRAFALPEWRHSVSHMAIRVDYTRWSKNSVWRTWKYYNKGFEVFVPGLDRGAFDGGVYKDFYAQGMGSQCSVIDDGLKALMHTEAQILWKLEHLEKTARGGGSSSSKSSRVPRSVVENVVFHCTQHDSYQNRLAEMIFGGYESSISAALTTHAQTLACIMATFARTCMDMIRRMSANHVLTKRAAQVDWLNTAAAAAALATQSCETVMMLSDTDLEVRGGVRWTRKDTHDSNNCYGCTFANTRSPRLASLYDLTLYSSRRKDFQMTPYDAS